MKFSFVKFVCRTNKFCGSQNVSIGYFDIETINRKNAPQWNATQSLEIGVWYGLYSKMLEAATVLLTNELFSIWINYAKWMNKNRCYLLVMNCPSSLYFCELIQEVFKKNWHTEGCNFFFKILVYWCKYRQKIEFFYQKFTKVCKIATLPHFPQWLTPNHWFLTYSVPFLYSLRGFAIS